MAKPREVRLSPSENKHSGIRAEYVKSRRVLRFYAWSSVYVEGREMTLAEFLREAGITEADCRAAYRDDVTHALCNAGALV
jgi:hypothetical protein